MTDDIPKIRKLEETVVNRIAAGEVVQRPSSAIKELVENSLDAGATSISVTIKQGGLQLIQIQDNGHGIRKDDLDIVCERFTTSKLSSFEDLKQISTFGFRGEALASITHVAHVNILTRTKDSPCAYKARYCDGKLIGANGAVNSPGEVKACAGVQGTTITVEDLFYNMPTRKQAFKNTNDEYQRVLDVITKYAIRYGDDKVAFTCKKQGQLVPDLHTSSTSSTLDNIRIAYGPQVARELIDFQVEYQDNPSSVGNVDTETGFGSLRFSVRGKVSNANFSSKKPTYIFFINNRLVESNSIRKLIESVYQDVLPKHSHPFVYLSISMPSHHVDVNVHPTKREVHFLYEDLFLEKIYAKLAETLRHANDSRSFQVTRLLSTNNDSNIPSSSARLSSSFLASDDVEDDDTNTQTRSQAKFEGNGESVLPADTQQMQPAQSRIAHKPPQDLESDLDEEDIVFSRDTFRRSFAGSSSAGSVGEKRKASAVWTMSSSSGGNMSATKSAKPPSAVSSVAPNKLIRTDHRVQKIDTFFRPSQHASVPYSSASKRDPTESSNTPAEMEVGNNNSSELIFCMSCIEEGETLGSTEDQQKAWLQRFQCACCGDKVGPNEEDIDDEVLADLDNVVSTTVAASKPSEPLQDAPVLTTSAPRPVLLDLLPSRCEYASVHTLTERIHQQKDSALERVFKQYTFVGVVNCDFSLIQFQTKLLLVDHSTFLTHLFYQLCVFRFAEMDYLQLATPLRIDQLVRDELHASLEDKSTILFNPQVDGDMDHVCRKITTILTEKGELLEEYFRISINGQGYLSTLPALIPTQGKSRQYCPDIEWLGNFLILLALETDWDDELKCFQQVALHIGDFYAKLSTDENKLDPTTASSLPLLKDEAKFQLEDLLYPAMKKYLVPSRAVPMASTVIEVASLEQMYKIFERC